MPKAKSLSDFPRPNVAVDLAVLTVAPAADTLGPLGALSVLVLRDATGHGVLPGRFIRERRTIAETVREVIEMKLELDPGDFSPVLLRVFDDPHRDARGWALSIAHAVTLPAEHVAGTPAELVAVEPSGELVTGETIGYDHNEIVREAVAAIRERYEAAPDPDGLLEGPFTLSELRHVHEAVLGDRLRKDTFNRRMSEQLEPLYDERGEPLLRRGVGRPAQLFERKAADHPMAHARRNLPRADWA